MRFAAIAAGVILITFTRATIAADGDPQHNWPQWRGPLCTGASATARPPTTWAADRNIRWKTRLPGSGTATPIVWGDQIFIQSAIATNRQGEPPNEAGLPRPSTMPASMAALFTQPTRFVHQFILLCIDRRTGKTLWQQVAREAVPHDRHHRDHGYASASPATDGRHVLAYFGSRGLHCYDMDGKLKWSKDLGLMRMRNNFGEGSSPAIHDGMVIVNWDHEGEDFIAAFDIPTGRELWRQARDEPSSWSTPLIVEHQGKRQVIVSATHRIRSYDLATGKPLWECAGMTMNVIPTPVAADGMVYPISGFRGSALLAIRLGREGDLTGTDAIAWTHRKQTPYVPSPLLYDGRLYFNEVNKNVFTCMEAKTGRVLFGPRAVDGLEGVYASPVAADGKVYLVGRNGTTVVLKAADTFEALATNRLNEGIDASPAMVGKDLILRGRQHLYCIGE